VPGSRRYDHASPMLYCGSSERSSGADMLLSTLCTMLTADMLNRVRAMTSHSLETYTYYTAL
jgi:hypothetical protein